MPAKELDPYSAERCVTLPLKKVYNVKVPAGDQAEDGLEKYQRELEEEDELWTSINTEDSAIKKAP